LRAGFWIGLAFGLAASLYFQIQPRLSAGATSVFTGAPLGLDEWVYFALARAVLRSPTGLTYSYPFALFWEAPPVLVQLPIALAAWIGRLTGLPVAFEILRVLGTAFSGGCLAIMGACLFRHRGWRAWFYVAAALGGAWFWVLAVVEAIGTAGVYGLTELPTYLQRAMGPIYWWLPFLAQNVWLPLEAVYHALVLGALALLLCGRRRAAAWLGLATWFSNPFPAVSLYAVALPGSSSKVSGDRLTSDRARCAPSGCGSSRPHWAMATMPRSCRYGLFWGSWGECIRWPLPHLPRWLSLSRGSRLLFLPSPGRRAHAAADVGSAATQNGGSWPYFS
jgi:hypothetical protein